MSYCAYCLDSKAKQVHVDYHNNQYGFPVQDDNELFGRLLLEINQAGLSWETVLNKQENFRVAYDQFNIKRIANYSEEDRARLLSDPGIIRNKLKVNAAIHNAQQILQLTREYGSFSQWLDQHHTLSLAEWTKLFKKTFKFVGGKIVNEFLMSIGYLPGAHDKNCPIFAVIEKTNPKWKEI